MRLWTGRSSWLGSVVNRVQDSISEPSELIQCSHKPAIAKGSSFFIWMRTGCLWPFILRHS